MRLLKRNLNHPVVLESRNNEASTSKIAPIMFSMNHDDAKHSQFADLLKWDKETLAAPEVRINQLQGSQESNTEMMNGLDKEEAKKFSPNTESSNVLITNTNEGEQAAQSNENDNELPPSIASSLLNIELASDTAVMPIQPANNSAVAASPIVVSSVLSNDLLDKISAVATPLCDKESKGIQSLLKLRPSFKIESKKGESEEKRIMREEQERAEREQIIANSRMSAANSFVSSVSMEHIPSARKTPIIVKTFVPIQDEEKTEVIETVEQEILILPNTIPQIKKKEENEIFFHDVNDDFTVIADSDD